MKREFPDWIEGFLQYTDETEPSRLFRAWSAISVVGAALRRKCYLPWGSETFYPNMYIVLVGPPAARKGTALKPAREFMQGLGLTVSADETSRQALIQSLKESMAQNMDLKTGEMVWHSSLVIYSPELSVFLRQDNELLEILCDWYDCRDNFEYRTLSRGSERTTNVWAHMLGATTPTALQRSMPIEAFGTGLGSRIIFIYQSDKEKIVIFPGGDEAIKNKLKIDLEAINSLCGRFSYTDGFVERYTYWRYESEKNPPFTDDKLLGYLQRRPTQVFKLSMICNASRTDNMIITEADFEKALHYLTWAETYMPQTFYGMGQNPLGAIQARVMSIVMTHKKIKASELMAMFQEDVTKQQMSEIIGTLEYTGFLGLSSTGEVYYCSKKGGKNENTEC